MIVPTNIVYWKYCIGIEQYWRFFAAMMYILSNDSIPASVQYKLKQRIKCVQYKAV